jgi:hypothetical protein
MASNKWPRSVEKRHNTLEGFCCTHANELKRAPCCWPADMWRSSLCVVVGLLLASTRRNTQFINTGGFFDMRISNGSQDVPILTREKCLNRRTDQLAVRGVCFPRNGSLNIWLLMDFNQLLFILFSNCSTGPNSWKWQKLATDGADSQCKFAAQSSVQSLST